MNELTKALLEAGLIQFGDFETGDGFRPFQTSLEMLASYPEVLRLASAMVAPAPQDTEYLLAAPDAVALAMSVGLEKRLPVVYSRGSDDPPVHDLVGAYDIGHSTMLLAGATNDPEQLAGLIHGARHVGLKVHTALALVETAPLLLDGAPIRSLVRLSEVAGWLVQNGKLPEGQARAVDAWIEARRTSLAGKET